MTNAPRPRRRQADRSSQAIQALRTTALDMILEGGISSLNLSALGDRAGYSRSIVHYYFGSKEALLADILETLTQASAISFRDIPRGLDGIIVTIEALMGTVRKQPQQVLARIVLLNEAAVSNSAKLTELAVRYNETIRGGFEELMSEEEAVLERLGMSSAQISVMLLALIRGVHEQWLAERASFDMLQGLDQIRKFILATMVDGEVATLRRTK